jgi:hypothetical protein
MPALSPWNLDPTRLLTRRELATVLADLAPRARRFANVQRNLVVVRLACCCGLRVSEIAALQLDDVVVDVPRPHLRLRRGTTKGGRSAACPCGGMLARWPISRRGRLSVWPTAPAAPIRSSVRCKHTGVACPCDGQLSGAGFCPPARSWEWPAYGA